MYDNPEIILNFIKLMKNVKNIGTILYGVLNTIISDILFF
jgi:hypothetical protein